MKNKRLILGFLFLIAVLVWTAFFTWPDKNFKVTFCDVGQGDAIFVTSPSGFQMLVDGGPSNKVLECLSREMPFWDRNIDLIVLSHPHSDHLTGLIDVIKRYDVGQILSTDAVHTSPEYLEWLKLIQEKKITLEVAYQVSQIDLGAGTKADVLFPRVSYKDKKIEDLNNTSVVLRLEYAGVSFLLPGDLEEKEQKQILNSYLNSTFLKVPHHGSKDALDQKFLDSVAPKMAIISVGKNSFGHPTQETIQKLKNKGVEIKRTDQDGTIKVVVDTDGKYRIE
ncbi:MAG: MBL fold metallo-hydrolase [Candidatus Berkelbacteria bacterium]|nr:MBL fold metallo-hydrolase [Candidatus Berkelbacteria bacterium]